MAAKELPSQEALRQLLAYDAETGALTWRERGVEMFPAKTHARAIALCRLWNKRYSGQEALACINDGYKAGWLVGGNYRAHRVVWKWITGQEPDQIDHVNGDRADNRFSNLRDVTGAVNAKNRKRSSNNKTGVQGVHRWAHRSIVYWVATAPNKEKTKYFHCIGQAIRARKEIERSFGFHENHGRAA